MRSFNIKLTNILNILNLNSSLFPNVDWIDMAWDTYDTLYMTFLSAIFIFILGLVIGILLFTTSQNRVLKWVVYPVLSAIVNILRAIPFMILIILLIPYTKSLMGTMIGPDAALPALIIGTAPFYGRIVETGLREVDKGVIEAAKAMGASPLQLMLKVLIPESLPSIVSGMTTTIIALIGYTAMAGVIGAGGLGNTAYYIGYQRGRYDVTFVSTVIIILLVFIFQWIGNSLTKKIDKR